MRLGIAMIHAEDAVRVYQTLSANSIQVWPTVGMEWLCERLGVKIPSERSRPGRTGT